MKKRIYYWIHHTGRYDGNSGVQRVCRLLARALAAEDACDFIPVRWNKELEAIVCAEDEWLKGLARFDGPSLSSVAHAGTPLHLAPANPDSVSDAWLLLPEVPHVDNASSVVLPVALDYARYHGLRIAAVFYDLIPLRVAGYEAMAASHEAYAHALAGVDLVLPISRYSGGDLRSWWDERGYDPGALPTISPIPLAEEVCGAARVFEPHEPVAPPLRFLAVGTVEPRKNQVALLRAFLGLTKRRADLDLRLDIVGSIHPAVADAVADAVNRAEGRVTLHGFLAEDAMQSLLRECHATAFISLAEGYGLPIVESMWHGKPCLCSNIGAMAEIAEQGGCLTVNPFDLMAIEHGLERLADDPSLRRRLAEESAKRPSRGWDGYAAEIIAALNGMPSVTRLVVIEGSVGGARDYAAELKTVGATAIHLHWHPRSKALLPGRRLAPEHPILGMGYMRGGWAVLPLASTGEPIEATEIVNEAHGLGLGVALVVGPHDTLGDSELTLLGVVDLVLFARDEDRETVLARALRTLPKTALLRHRLRTAGTGAAIACEISAERPSITTVSAPHRPRRVFYWVGLTVTQPFNSGIQRVTRMLGAALDRLGIDVIPVRWDEASGRMISINKDEAAILAKWEGQPARPSTPLPPDLAGEWLLVPEITVPLVPPGSNVARLGRSLGMRVAAVFYDLTPAKMPEYYPPGTLEAFRAYWACFSESDLALPISWTVAADLQRYMRAQGLTMPAIVPCPLAGDLPSVPRQRIARRLPDEVTHLRLLAVGTWEPRKNYPRLLRGLAIARRALAMTGKTVELVIVGRRTDYYAALNEKIEGLAAGIGGVTLHEHLSDAEMTRMFEQSDATIYASWEEGFGLPVVESLWRGLPCICHDGSSLVEVAAGGGTIATDMLDEDAIAQSIIHLVSDRGLLTRLSEEAVHRPIRDWDDYGQDVLAALARVGTAPGWPLPAIITDGPRPLLSCAITTYNRAQWLSHSLPRLLEATRPWRDLVEVVVCDNTSTDNTPDVVSRYRDERNFVAHRNPQNVGMLGNLGATARASRGAYIWLLGDDDLIVDGAIENILEGLARHPEVEMAYMNYSWTQFDKPEQLVNAKAVIHNAKPIGSGGANRRVAALRDVAGLNENLFTAIYACAFRRDHALRAYQQDVQGRPFSSLSTCVPSSVYALKALHDRPAWWVAEPAVVVNMNVSWLRWALLWHLERMPDLFDLAEQAGVDPAQLDPYRLKHCAHAGEWARAVYFQAEDDIRNGFSMARLLERCKHIEEFRTTQVPLLRDAYAAAWTAQKVAADLLPPEKLFQDYGF